jgi:hypothetical protein
MDAARATSHARFPDLNGRTLLCHLIAAGSTPSAANCSVYRVEALGL